MRAHAIVSATWHSPAAENLRHSRLLGAILAVALAALTALAVTRVKSVLPGPSDFGAWAAEPYRWYVANALSPP